MQIQTGRDLYIERKIRRIARRNLASRIGKSDNELAAIENLNVPVPNDIAGSAMAVFSEFDARQTIAA